MYTIIKSSKKGDQFVDIISQQTVKYQANQTDYMVKIVEMDEHVKLEEQLDEDVGSVILLNKFNVNPEDVDEFIKRWAADAAAFKKQPGFISAQLHRGVAGSGTFINYAVWESAAHLKKAVSNVDIQARISEYPPGIVISPHVFKKVAVPGICVD